MASLLPCTVHPKRDSGIPLDRCFLQWSRDEAFRHLRRLILFWSVKPRLCSIRDTHAVSLGLGGLTFMQLTTTYAPVIAGHNVGHVFLGMNQRCTSSEWLRPIQIFRVRNGCCWARRRIILVGTPKPWCKSRPGVIISKGTASYICASFALLSHRFHKGPSTHDPPRVFLPPSTVIVNFKPRRRG